MATGLFNLKQVNQAISQGAWSGYIAPRWVEYLVVAGGGGGGRLRGAGGGAGGLLTGIVTVAAGTSYTVTVGGGGTGATTYGNGITGSNGVASVFGNISATGGGGGASAGGTLGGNGASGGSGGGSTIDTNTGTLSGTAGQGTFGQGNAGCVSILANMPAGGGGGGAGTIAPNYGNNTGGNGGAGIASSITGTVVVYAGGGGGGIQSVGAAISTGVGGVGGGGTAGFGAQAGSNGTANTGGGGGGDGNAGASPYGGTGGSGIVIVRYPGNVQFFTGGTVNYNNGYIIHIFTSNGTLAPTAPTVYNTSYQISRSLRFNGADSTKLTRTPSSSTSGTLGTFSFWTKLGPLVSGSNNGTFISAADSYAYGQFYQNTLYFGNTTNYLNTTAVFRDFSAWYHIVFAFDTTQATSTNRLKIYVNGVLQTAGSLASYPAQNASFPFLNGTQQYQIGGNGFSSSVEYYNGYMTEMNFIDGQALTPSSFGATSTTTGVWSPIQYSGSYATNGFYLNFSDNSNTTAATLGKDYSGNGNNWTPNNFSVTAGSGNDSLVDTPTQYGFDTGVGGQVRGNYATWNALGSNKPNLTNGNLDADGQDLKTAISTMGVSSGKWYWEILIRSGTDTPNMGVTSFANDNADPGVYLGAGRSYVSSGGGNGIYKNYTATSTVADSDFSNANTAGAIIGFALDCDAGTLAYYVNNVLGYTDSTVATGTVLFPMTCNFNSTTNAYRNTSVNFGQRPFAYTAPSGFKALCTQNLPTPTIGATSETQAAQYFTPTTYTGNGSASRAIANGINMATNGGLVWSKQRSGVEWHFLIDSVRGNTKYLSSNATNAEGTISTLVTSFDSTGYSIGNDSGINSNGSTYVSWVWGAGGSGSSNTAGSITSTVSANTTSGFSVVTYTGTGANATVGHGLGVAPAMVIVKNRTTAGNSWCVWHKNLTDGNYVIFLNDTGAQISIPSIWNATVPTSTVFSIGTATGTNASANNLVAYCFAPIAGYSAFGSYTGNGSADGPFVYCGFKPRWILIKASSASTYGSWRIWDTTRNPYNVMKSELYPNLSDAEDSAQIGLDATSNGFKVRSTISGVNGSAETFIFAAFAENPFKYSLAR